VKEKSIFILALVLALILFIPLNSENKESSDKLDSAKNKDKEKNIINTNLSQQEKKTLIDLKSFQLVNPENKTHKLKLILDEKNAVFNPESHKYLKRPIKLQKFEKSMFTASLITFTALNIADYISTTQALKYGSLKESNPIMRPFTKNILLYTVIKLGLTAYVYHDMKNLHKKNKKLAWIISMAANLAMSYIVINNIRMIHKAQGR